jgi:hypothetical protein
MQEDRPLASRFENFEAMPSEALWGKIEAGLGEKKQRRPVFWWFFGSAATLVLAFGLVPFYGDGDSNAILSAQKSLEKSTLIASKKVKFAKSSSLEKKSMAAENNSVIPSLSNAIRMKTKMFISRKVHKSPLQEPEQILELDDPAITPEPLAQTSKSVEEKKLPTVTEGDSVFSESPSPIPPFIIDPGLETDPPLKQRGFELGFSLGSGRGVKITNNTVPNTPSIPAVWSNELFDQENEDPNIEYWLPLVPVQLHLFVGKDIAKKFRITTGLGWNMYKEKVLLKVPQEFAISTPRNYLQLPFTFDYKIIQNQKLEWTTGPGILLGYNHIKNGNVKTNRYTSSVQWQSALRFQLTNNWSIFLQPHYRYQLRDSQEAKSALFRNHFYGLNLGVVQNF